MKTIANELINRICEEQGAVLINVQWNTSAPVVENYLLKNNIAFEKTQIELFEELRYPDEIYEFIPGTGCHRIKNPDPRAGETFLSSKGFDVTFTFSDGSTLRSIPQKNVNSWNPGNCIEGFIPGSRAENAI